MYTFFSPNSLDTRIQGWAAAPAGRAPASVCLFDPLSCSHPSGLRGPSPPCSPAFKPAGREKGVEGALTLLLRVFDICTADLGSHTIDWNWTMQSLGNVFWEVTRPDENY